MNDRVLNSDFNFWIWEQNPAVWPVKWNLFASTCHFWEWKEQSQIFLVSFTEVYRIKNGKVSMYLNVDSFVYLPNFNQESNKTAYNDDSVSFIVHHIQENNDWLEHIEEYRTNRQAFQSLTTSPELDICKLYNSVIIIITQLHHRVKTISSRRSLLTGDKLNKVRRVRHTVMQCSTLTKKNLEASWPPRFHFLSPEQVFWLPNITFKN